MNLSSKQDFENLLIKYLKPLKEYYSENCARLRITANSTWYEDISVETEAFARPLWGLAPYRYGGGDKLGEFDEIYLRGIISGTNPKSDEYWGECHDADQRFVEMSALAYALMLLPDKLWTPLNDEQKENLKAWLNIINQKKVIDSNWLFFRIMVNCAFKKLNVEYDKENLAKDLARINEFYLGDGWYRDGHSNQKDYYNAFAFHFFGLVYSVFFDDEQARIFKSRAESFAGEYIYWFADDGEALPYGRSLTYRFAQTAFWSMCVVADIKTVPVGVVKGIITRNLKMWSELPITDNGGILTVGYKYPNILMAEHYNAVGSTYWSMMAFAVMMLKDDNEFWKIKSEPMPHLDSIRVMKNADMVVTRLNGEVTAYPIGKPENYNCGQIAAKYVKFAYSTQYGFNVSKSNMSLEEAAADSTLCFVYDGLVLMRKDNISGKIDGNNVSIVWSPIKGIVVETEVIPTEYGHRRVHKITSDLECSAYDCGFAVATNDKYNAEISCEGQTAEVKNTDNICRVTAGANGTGFVINTSPNTNLFYPKTAVPCAKYEIKKGITLIQTEVYQK